MMMMAAQARKVIDRWKRQIERELGERWVDAEVRKILFIDNLHSAGVSLIEMTKDL